MIRVQCWVNCSFSLECHLILLVNREIMHEDGCYLSFIAFPRDDDIQNRQNVNPDQINHLELIKRKIGFNPYIKFT